VLAAAFQALTPRTAGLNTIDIGSLNPATLFIITALMFIGGAPGGTAGGSRRPPSGSRCWRSGRRSSSTLADLRRRALDGLRARHQQMNPFTFIICSEWAGADLPPVE
jgi:hypothetical protein